MHRLSKVSDKFRLALNDRIDRRGGPGKALKYSKSVTPSFVDMEHAAGIKETSREWLNLKEELAYNAPVGHGGFPDSHIRLLTIMGEKTPKHLVPHGGDEGEEKPLGAHAEACQKRAFAELYDDAVFVGYTGTKEASLGIAEQARDAASRVEALFRFKDLCDRGILHQYLDMPRGKSHLELALQHDVFIVNYAVTRRQMNKPKSRMEAVADKVGLEEIDFRSRLFGNTSKGDPFMVCRYRNAQGGPGVINLAGSVFTSAMITSSKRRFPNYLVHRSSSDVAAKIENWLKSRDPNPKNWYMLSFDVAGMEKFTPSMAHRECIKYVNKAAGPKYGVFDLIHNVPIIAASGYALDPFISSSSFNYTDDSLLGYGTRSGAFTVVATNQGSVAGGMIELFEKLAADGLPGLHKGDWHVADLDGQGESDVMILSMTDDNTLVTTNKALYEKLVGNKFKVAGELELEFETVPQFEAGKAASFLAYIYEIKPSGEVKVYKDMVGGFGNVICSETGLKYSDELRTYVRGSPKGDSILPAGMGYLLRMSEYLTDEDDGMLMWETLAKAFEKKIGKQWYDLYPVSSLDIAELEKAVVSPESINGIEWMLKEKPDLIHRGNFQPEDIPEEIRDKFFLSVSPKMFRELFGEHCPTEEPGAKNAKPKNFVGELPNRERFLRFLAETKKSLSLKGL